MQTENKRLRTEESDGYDRGVIDYIQHAAATGHPDHDLMRLHTSGYLEGLGFDYLPATSSTTFRLPDTFERAYFATA